MKSLNLNDKYSRHEFHWPRNISSGPLALMRDLQRWLWGPTLILWVDRGI
jgi:hypothetical protein